jgi:hypothetical protein
VTTADLAALFRPLETAEAFAASGLEHHWQPAAAMRHPLVPLTCDAVVMPFTLRPDFPLHPLT